jgi:L-iditol 2-dehydrogenase
MATATTNDLQAQTPAPVPTIMRAAVYRGVNDVRVETVPVPEIGPGEVLIRVHSCGVCGTDLKKIPHRLALRAPHLRS